MKKLLFIFSILALSAAPLAHAQQIYTLKSCLEQGLQNNYSLRITHNEEQVSKNNATLGNAGYLPTVDLTAGYQNSVSTTKNTLRETGEVMGKIKYQRDYCRYNTDSISIGYELSRRYRHNGYMTEALRAMVQNAFEVMNVEVVAISHFVGNEPSRKVIERAGFIFEGVMPCGFKRFDGEIFDNVCYSILRSEYDTGLISSVRRMR